MNTTIEKIGVTKKAFFAFFVLLLVNLTSVNAQDTPSLHKPLTGISHPFSNYPDTIPFTKENFTVLFAQPAGKHITLQLNSSLKWDGSIIDVAHKYNGVIKSVSIHLKDYPGMVLLFTQTLLPADQYLYRCFVFGKDVQDCFVLYSKGENNYLLKKDINRLRNE